MKNECQISFCGDVSFYLFCSSRAMESYRDSLFEKPGVKTRVALALYDKDSGAPRVIWDRVHSNLSRAKKPLNLGNKFRQEMTKEQFLALAESRYAELSALDKEKNFYDYEKKFSQIMTDLSRELLEAKLGEVPSDRRKKKKL